MMRLISNVSVSSQKKDEKKKKIVKNKTKQHALVNMHVFMRILQKPSVNTKFHLKIVTSYIFNLEENVVKKKEKKNKNKWPLFH